MSIVAGSPITAADGIALAEGQFVYAASSGSANAYVLAPTLNSGAYTAGAKYKFKANFTNTGAATLNVSSLGAKTLKKLGGVDLAAGDIQSGMVVEAIYDGTYMQIVSALYIQPNAIGTFTHSMSSTTTTTIAHGLGRTPKMVRIRGMELDSGDLEIMEGVINGAGQAGISVQVGQGISGDSTTYAIVFSSGNGSNTLSGSVTFDGTNITITWTSSNSPSGTAHFVWEAIS